MDQEETSRITVFSQSLRQLMGRYISSDLILFFNIYVHVFKQMYAQTGIRLQSKFWYDVSGDERKR